MPESTEFKTKNPSRARRVICTLAIVVVLLLNIVLGVFSYKKLWHIDLTEPKYEEMESFFTPSENFLNIVKNEAIPSVDKINAKRSESGLKPLKVKIIFCMDSDKLEGSENTKYVHHTARQLKNEYPDHVEIEYTDSEKNPSSVQEYKVTSATRIYSTDVIITFGTEFVVHSLASFYSTDTDTGEVWGYNGEKKFASTILSLTRADSPVCVLTTNHGEKIFNTKNGEISVKDEYSSFIKIIEGAGYRVEFLNFETDEIPENCRMIISFAPSSDFHAFGNLGESGISEIEKLDRYLDESRSFFYICDTDTPMLENLEEYLSEWGIAPSRETTASGLEENYKLFDMTNSANSDGSLIIGKYTASGLGASVTADLRGLTYPPAVAFGNASAIGHSQNYNKTIVLPDDFSSSTTADEKSIIYTYYHNGVSRTMYDIFTTNATAYAQVGETQKYASENNLYSLFTLTEEVNQVQEDSLSMVTFSSYVLGLSSTEFLKNEFLDSASYGNADVLLSALRATSSETVPVNIDAKAFYSAEINETLYALTNKTTPTILLAAIPLFLCIIVGGVVCIKRKYL